MLYRVYAACYPPEARARTSARGVSDATWAAVHVGRHIGQRRRVDAPGIGALGVCGQCGEAGRAGTAWKDPVGRLR